MQYLQIYGQQMHDVAHETRKRLFLKRGMEVLFIICSSVHFFFFFSDFYSQTVTQARQICRVLIASKNRPVSRIAYGEGTVYPYMFISCHSLGNAKITHFIPLARYVNNYYHGAESFLRS